MTLDLFSTAQLDPGPAVTKRRRLSIEERFASFHAANPHVMTDMLGLALGRLLKGEKRIGAKALWEELRRYLFTYAHEVRGVTYKLDNSLTALYARALIEREPRLVGVIETRVRKSQPALADVMRTRGEFKP